MKKGCDFLAKLSQPGEKALKKKHHILSDNYFDMNAGKKTVEILEGSPKTIVLRSVYDIR